MNRIIINADITEADLKALTEQFGEGSIKFIKLKTRGRKKGFKLKEKSKFLIEPELPKEPVKEPEPAPVVKKVEKKKIIKKDKTKKDEKRGSFYDPYF